MQAKLVAIGNRLMCDDSIALRVAERLRGKLALIGIEVVVCETDVSYGISRIEVNDVIFLLDATYSGLPVGQVTFSGDDLKRSGWSNQHAHWHAHELSLLDLLRTQVRFARGYFLGIEVEKIDFGLELSATLQGAFDDICVKVYEILRDQMEIRA